ncbi:MAG TPA: glycoside hydrolase family 99-like domain-containing protein [Candidatus Hydrogenedentes bacterium]|nr:glycoside hydrolase family 99-like domain-containing protein [Candidatus Hydrogenedentota bacterium]
MYTLAALIVTAACCALPAWEFDGAGLPAGWQPNAGIPQTAVEAGELRGRSAGSDPFFVIEGLDFPATPWQYVRLRVRYGGSGQGQLFWTGNTEGPFGGLTEERSARFSLRGGGEWEEVVLLPGWHREGRIVKFRLDLPTGEMDFALDHFLIGDYAAEKTPVTDPALLKTAGEWTTLPGDAGRFSPPLNIAAADAAWANVEIRAEAPCRAEVVWITPDRQGTQAEALEVDAGVRVYPVLLAGNPGWTGTLAAVGVRFPGAPAAEAVSLALSDLPAGEARPVVAYFGPEDGVNRVGRDCRVIAAVRNRGGENLSLAGWTLEAKELETVSFPEGDTGIPLSWGETGTLSWTLRADAPGDRSLILRDAAGRAFAEAVLPLLPPVSAPKTDYVPQPAPVKTSLDVCMYYFPGWENDAKWDCIRNIAPVRKPLLGYYDEANPEIVDWQIKWAVENGITCFLVDWYWTAGNQHLTHWFEAYRKCRYRDQLEVAIMWANHNPPNTHSREDWRAVTHEWIEKYFTLPAYYRINGKPAVFLWDPSGLRRDLGGSEEVKAALADSQQMAKDAGHAGIEFVAMHGHDAASDAAVLLAEGYAGATNYHEWGRAVEMAPAPALARFDDVAATAPEAWKRRAETCGPLTYYPVVDTGWDSRPWHGDKSIVLGGRNTAAFSSLLEDAKAFCAERRLPFVVLGPANEWGEGSYIEPNTEYGFSMYEAIRSVFAEGDPASWPVNLGPADLGLGPYDFPAQPSTLDWDFANGAGAWAPYMGMTSPEFRDGAMVFRTVTADPALRAVTKGLRASIHRRMRLTLSVAAPGVETVHGQLFWSPWGMASGETTALSFSLPADGAPHEVLIDLEKHPRWRGPVSSLRLDPCNVKDAEVRLYKVLFEEGAAAS